MDSIENITKIIFNDKLKYYIKEIHDTYNLNDLLSDDMKVIIKLQDQLRKVFTADMCFDIEANKSNKLTKGDFFTLFMCLITNIDKHSSYKTIFDNIKYKPDKVFEKRDFAFEIVNCSCSKNIHLMNAFMIKNTETNLSLVLECVCIEKMKYIKWSHLTIKLVKYNNKVYLANEKNKIQRCNEHGYNYALL
jgi:hypothetical protein